MNRRLARSSGQFLRFVAVALKDASDWCGVRADKIDPPQAACPETVRALIARERAQAQILLDRTNTRKEPAHAAD